MPPMHELAGSQASPVCAGTISRHCKPATWPSSDTRVLTHWSTHKRANCKGRKAKKEGAWAERGSRPHGPGATLQGAVYRSIGLRGVRYMPSPNPAKTVAENKIASTIDCLDNQSNQNARPAQTKQKPSEKTRLPRQSIKPERKAPDKVRRIRCPGQEKTVGKQNCLDDQ